MAGAALAGCAADKPPEPPTMAEIAITATADANPDDRGRASPVLVRVYRLASPTAFENADYYQIVDAAPATLGASLIGMEEIVVAPGEVERMTRTLEPNAGHLGFIAGSRSLDGARWRPVVPVPRHRTPAVDVTVARRSMTANAGP